MAENNDPNWRDRLSTDRATDKKAIEDSLNTTAGTVTVIAIIVLIAGWSIIETFFP